VRSSRNGFAACWLQRATTGLPRNDAAEPGCDMAMVDAIVDEMAATLSLGRLRALKR
jgi:hypothetical protein